MKNKLLLFMLVLVLGILAACGAGEEKSTGTETEGTEDKKVLVMGTSADYPPFEYVDTANGEEIIGFDIDVAKAIGEKLGYEIKVENMDFNSLIPAIEAGKFDFVIAGMSATPEREKVVDFTVPYYETQQVVLTMKDSGIESEEDLAGKTVGAQVSSIQLDYANEVAELIEGVKVESRDAVPQAIQELVNGRFAGVFIEDIVAENYVASNDKFTYFPVTIVGENEDKSIVLPKGSELKAEFDKAIQELAEDGTLDALKEKWFVVTAE